jgi:isoleucyl-tRNA synthetase
MAGYEVNFVPGWDCHGLPIEHKVLRDVGPEAEKLSRLEIRDLCQKDARKYMALQADQMQRLGTVGDYETPYYTMEPPYEAAVLEVFAELVRHGLVYRALKPVHWSIENRTALAEAELEYYDRDDVSIYVLFPLESPSSPPGSLGAPEGADLHLMIWTTTPWTLPANLAVAVAPNAAYGLYRFRWKGEERHVVLADNLARAVLSLGGAIEVEELGTCMGRELVAAGVRYRHPFIERVSPTVEAEYVTLEDGTGLVHTAPGHGAEDYATGIREGLEIYCPVRNDGTFDDTAPEWLRGRDVWEANGLVLERLEADGSLFHKEDIVHSYPHDWRGKTPTIFRATEQWFIGVDRGFGESGESLRERAMRHTESEVDFIPEWGRNRMRGMLESRPDWCISRQRSWGLPIPAFRAEGGEHLLTFASVRAVADHVRTHGSDAWFSSPPEVLLEGYDPAADEEAPESVRAAGRSGLAGLAKGDDVFDVWFESGSSWNGAMRRRGLGYPVDLYLEGSDQHRGWFQLSLLPGIGATGQPPFRALLTHGFIVTGQGEKMSKSLGNTIEVEDLLKKHGADVCRWWTASLNYTNDVKVEWSFFDVAGEEYRKVRNTIRFLLGNLADFEPGEHAVELTDADRLSLEWWARGEYARLVREVGTAYATYQFKRVRDAIWNFCNETMSAVYLAAVKDRLYCDAADGPRRRRTQTVLHEIAEGLIRLLAPVLVHTAEEAWLALRGDEGGSVHLMPFPEPFDWPVDEAWERVMDLRDEALKRLELAKEDPGISNPLDAGVVARVRAVDLEALEPFLPELADLCGVSRFVLEAAEEPSIEVVDLRDEPRCDRSWKRDGTVRPRSDGGTLSDRDAAVLGLP